MKLATFSILALSALPTFVEGQIRHRNGHGRLLEEVVLDSAERVLEESLSDEMEWVDFSVELSMSLSTSLSMSMHNGLTGKSSKKGFGKGPKGGYGKGSPIVTLSTGDSQSAESIPEVPLGVAVDHEVRLKRSYEEDARGAMKLVKT